MELEKYLEALGKFINKESNEIFGVNMADNPDRSSGASFVSGFITAYLFSILVYPVLAAMYSNLIRRCYPIVTAKDECAASRDAIMEDLLNELDAARMEASSVNPAYMSPQYVYSRVCGGKKTRRQELHGKDCMAKIAPQSLQRTDCIAKTSKDPHSNAASSLDSRIAGCRPLRSFFSRSQMQ